MKRKFALFAFNGEMMCFVHVLFNAIDMKNKDYDVKIIIEGSATKLLRDFENTSVPFYNLYKECIDKNILDCVCRACSQKMGTFKIAEKNNLPICNEMSGHPSMEKYINDGYEIITFG